MPAVLTGIASGIVETQTEDVEELSRIGSMIVFGIDVAYDWFSMLRVTSVPYRG